MAETPHHTTGTVLLGGVWGPWPPDELFNVEEEVFHLRRPMVSGRRVNGSNAINLLWSTVVRGIARAWRPQLLRPPTSMEIRRQSDVESAGD